uniref:Uncharacterized protein n=1 Tax=Parascaris univalens TaxID=6257 RepID=A0A914ZXR6_PARUN
MHRSSYEELVYRQYVLTRLWSLMDAMDTDSSLTALEFLAHCSRQYLSIDVPAVLSSGRFSLTVPLNGRRTYRIIEGPLVKESSLFRNKFCHYFFLALKL